MKKKVGNCLRLVRVKLNFLDDYADVDNGEGMKGDPFFGSFQRRMINEGRKIVGVKLLGSTFESLEGRERRKTKKSRGITFKKTWNLTVIILELVFMMRQQWKFKRLF